MYQADNDYQYGQPYRASCVKVEVYPDTYLSLQPKEWMFTYSCVCWFTGHYAMAAGDPAAAAVRFVAAAQTSPTPNQARLAAVAAALALLATDHPDNITKAAQILQQHEIFTSIDATLPYAERYQQLGVDTCLDQQSLAFCTLPNTASITVLRQIKCLRYV